MRKYLGYFLLIILLTSCQNQDKTENKVAAQDKATYKQIEVKPNDTLLLQVLRSQLADGKEVGGDEYESHQYTQKDLNAAAVLAQEILAENGYRFPERKEFAEKINSIFHRIPDASSAQKQLYVNFTDPCNKDQIYSRIEIIADGIFIEKNGRFITDLYAIPELIDYQTRFPESKNLEDSKIIKQEPDLGKSIEIPHWKDVSSLTEQRKKNTKKIVARNMYLFNNSRKHFDWLCLNDDRFLKNLIMVSGYTQDQDLVKWVLQDIPADKSHAAEFSKLLFHKTCNGKLIFHNNVLDVISKDKKAKDILSFLNNDYITYLFDTTDSNINLTVKEKEGITASIQSFGPF